MNQLPIWFRYSESGTKSLKHIISCKIHTVDISLKVSMLLAKAESRGLPYCKNTIKAVLVIS